LVYGEEAVTACRIRRSYSWSTAFPVFYGMTGWRLGGWWRRWLTFHRSTARPEYFLASSTVANTRRLPRLLWGTGRAGTTPEIFRERRDYLLPALRELGFIIPVVPTGAFYLYADCSSFTDDSQTLALDLLEHAGVAITPGLDFGSHQAARHARFSYANTLENLREGVSRLRDYFTNT
jgi:aspartate/methionine/tyrosine aminotransferase